MEPMTWCLACKGVRASERTYDSFVMAQRRSVAPLVECLVVLPGANRTASNRSRSSRGKFKSDLREAFQRAVPCFPGCRSVLRSRAGDTRFVIDMAASLAAPEVEYRSGFVNPDALGLTIRA
jgi:hypothetical protein